MTLEEFLAEWRNGNDRISVHTSGSTGVPKAMMVEKRRMEASARITCDFLGLKKDDTALLCLPMDYIAGKMMVVRSIVRGLKLQAVEPSGHPLSNLLQEKEPSGHPLSHLLQEKEPSGHPLSNLLQEKELSGHPLSNLQKGNESSVYTHSNLQHEDKLSGHPLHRIDGKKAVEGDVWCDLAAMVPMQVVNSLQVPEERRLLCGIRHLIIGGGAIDASLEEQLRPLPHAIWSTYGMTETLSHIALRRLNGPEASEWYTPFDGVGIRQSEDGCLIIDAPHVAEDLVVTHDIVELDADGRRFKILGRKDNVICSGGIKIQIEEVERLLQQHLKAPYMISKRKDKLLGEAVVLLTEDSDTKQMQQICHEVLPPYWRPRHIVHLEHLPMTENGKPARKEAEKILEK